MIEDLNKFISQISGFKDLKSAGKADFFAYYIINIDKKVEFLPSDILTCFSNLKLVPLTNVNRYLISNSNKAKPKKKKIKFLKSKAGYYLESSYCIELQNQIKDEETPFINYSINSDHFDWKPSDIPFVNSKIKSNADFFSKIYFLLYHLENSIRKFLTTRLTSIHGQTWESLVCREIDLGKAQSIRNAVSLSEMLPERGDTILYYCMWDDYGKFLKQYPTIFSNQSETDEVLAHLNSLAKIRNAVAHNASTIPKDYQDELTLFLKKYIKIMKKHQTSDTVNILKG